MTEETAETEAARAATTVTEETAGTEAARAATAVTEETAETEAVRAATIATEETAEMETVRAATAVTEETAGTATARAEIVREEAVRADFPEERTAERAALTTRLSRRSPRAIVRTTRTAIKMISLTRETVRRRCR